MFDACDTIPIGNTQIHGQPPLLGDARRSLQGYARCFPSQHYFQVKNLAESVIWADIVFNHDSFGTRQLRRNCIFAAATLGLVLCTSLFPWHAVTEFFQPLSTPSFHVFEGSSDEIAAKEVFVSLKRAFSEPWTSTSAIAWPFFALLAILSERLAISPMQTDLPMEGLWKSWLLSGNWSVPDVEAAGSGELQGPCDAEQALRAAHAAARAERETHLRQSFDNLSLAPAAAAQRVVWKCLEEYQDNALPQILTKPWATLWRGLDRLAAARDVTVSVTLADEKRIHLSQRSRMLLLKNNVPVTFPMSLHPPHILGLVDAEDAYWFLADRVRASGLPHCNPAFQYVAEMLDFHRTVKGGQWVIHLVDIGAHLGDCCLWAATRWSKGVRVLAVEMRKDNSASIRRASQLAQHPEGVLEVQALQVVAEAKCNQEVSTVDCILDQWASKLLEVHLVSLYLGFNLELEALRGALRWLEAGRVQGVLVRSTTTEVKLFHSFVEEHQLPYRVVTLRTDHDLLLVLFGSYLDMALQ